MNDKQMNWHRMFQKVNGVFSDNATTVAKYSPIEKSYKTFHSRSVQIAEIAAAGSRNSKGVFESKLELKDDMANEAAELAAGAYAYAKDAKDTELMAVLDVTYSEIRYADDQAALSMATAVYNELNGLVAELEDYLITAKDLATLSRAIEAYKANRENTSRQDSVARTRQLAGLFNQANDHLREHLDKLMDRIRRKEPVFFDTYTNARVILDLGAGRKKETPSELME